MSMLHLDVCLIMRPLHVHLGGGVALVGDYHYWALLTLLWDPHLWYKSGADG